MKIEKSINKIMFLICSIGLVVTEGYCLNLIWNKPEECVGGILGAIAATIIGTSMLIAFIWAEKKILLDYGNNR
jgi:hypothetical protein